MNSALFTLAHFIWVFQRSILFSCLRYSPQIASIYFWRVWKWFRSDSPSCKPDQYFNWILPAHQTPENGLFIILYLFISEQIPTPAHNKNHDTPPERGGVGGERPAFAPGQRLGLAGGEAPGPGPAAKARPGGKRPGSAGGESPEPGRLGPASRWLCAATCRAPWHRHGQAGQQLPSGPSLGHSLKPRAPSSGPPPPPLFLLSGPAHKERGCVTNKHRRGTCKALQRVFNNLIGWKTCTEIVAACSFYT